MSKIVLDAIALDLATLSREVATPTGALEYGTDISCVLDADANLTEVDPFSPVGIGQALLRRLITPRGTLPDDRDYGLDVRAYCNRGVPVNELRDVGGAIRLEITKDDRIADATVSVTTPGPNELSIAIRVTPEDPALTPFTLVIAATSQALTLEFI